MILSFYLLSGFFDIFNLLFFSVFIAYVDKTLYNLSSVLFDLNNSDNEFSYF